jgi:phosphatidylinositol alpha-1,6-mannosyltransferase
MTIEAMKIIKEKFPQVVYVVIGDGDFKKEYERMADSMGLKDSVIFAGGVSDEELSAYYSICDVFVMPSRVEENERGIFSEGFGLVFLEANYFGKPVIGGEGGCRDAVIDGKTGFIVNPKSPEDIAEKVLLLLRNDEMRKKMGEEGKKWAESVLPEDIRDFLLKILSPVSHYF